MPGGSLLSNATSHTDLVSRFRYRADIDGLRAVAVSLVLLFHAGFGFSGGFVGVDVFFVISGFLITGLIVRDLRSQTFSFSKFWERRIRRILPASLLVASVTLVVGIVVLLPRDLEDLSSSVMAQQGMLSNVYFWLSTGYFDGAADTKPMLHTWSLAVEEQFYLVFPLVLVVLHRVGARKGPAVFGIVAIVSLVGSQWGVLHMPSATFYLLPTRAWELLVGSIVVLLPAPVRLRKRTLESFSLAGMFAILYAATQFDSTTQFPGFSALLPCLGTALVLYGNSLESTLCSRVLLIRPLVAVGLISYSLYLWHWPILAFIRYVMGNELAIGVRVAALVLSLIFAALSWRFVETPLRRGLREFKLRRVFITATTTAAILAAFAFCVNAGHGLPGRLPQGAQEFLATQTNRQRDWVDIEQIRANKVPMLGVVTPRPQTPPDFLIWGDSHAMALSEVLDAEAKKYHLQGKMISRSSTIPALDCYRPLRGKYAIQWNRAALDYIKRNRIPRVILAARWAVNIEGHSNKSMDALIADDSSLSVTPGKSKRVLERSLLQTVNELCRMDVEVYILKQMPLQDVNPERRIILASMFGWKSPVGVSLEEHRTRQKNVNEVFEAIVRNNSHVHILDPTEYCFTTDSVSLIQNENGIFYADETHLSIHGASVLMAPLIDKLFDTMTLPNTVPTQLTTSIRGDTVNEDR